MKEWLFGKTLRELEDIAIRAGMLRFTAKQIADWLYAKNVSSMEDMTNLSLKNREALAKDYDVGGFAPEKVQTSADGTKKYLFPTLRREAVEAAYIPDGERATLCVSSQAGCRMGCRFCMTARQGFLHNLSAGEILGQIKMLPERDSLTNVVYMGMGEPLDNTDEVLKSLEILTSAWGYGWSPSRITLSTIGVMPGLKRFLDGSRVHLAVSLHNPFDDERLEIMPAQNAHPLSGTLDLLRGYDFTHQRRVSFEYIMFAGVNDTARHANELARVLNGIKARVNLIRFHKIPGCGLTGSDRQTMEKFRDKLTAKGIITTIRASRGEDISAACGMLSTKNNIFIL